jgi:hypothetical protein
VIAFTDTSPDTAVLPAEYRRLLGYPRSRELDGRAQALAEEARAWFAAHGRPWVYAREASSLELLDGDVLRIDGVRFVSPRLHATLSEARSERVVLAAFSAGPELECEAQRRWLAERPDEYFFLEIYGSAVVERLATVTGARLCAAADAQSLVALPHYSPGYDGWDLTEQARLLELVRGTGAGTLPGPLEVFDSGMLRPKKAQLAVFGLAPQRVGLPSVAELVPCENCSLPRCVYRRAPYRRPRQPSEVELMTGMVAEGVALLQDHAAAAAAPPLTLNARYATNLRALRRWAAERLTLTAGADGGTDALFRYEGSTCNTMGRDFCFHYMVHLGARAAGYPILEQRCVPAPGDEGHTQMCRYRTTGPALLAVIEADRPLLGRPLDAVLAWQRAPTGPTCYCESEGRSHKWGLVLETIHWALAQREHGQVTKGAPGAREATR